MGKYHRRRRHRQRRYAEEAESNYFMTGENAKMRQFLEAGASDWKMHSESIEAVNQSQPNSHYRLI